MNKTDIIELVATEMDCSKVQAGKAVEAVIKSLREGILDAVDPASDDQRVGRVEREAWDAHEDVQSGVSARRVTKR
ncbi:hypothetical protein [Thioclava electrotropha]|uniref:hypothetical protein n=1 Tax=Thioclava electrotropha TaxID=1549850 RepID=UPI0023A84E89|nr:hypothetical protein [Thioclava electrotropha]